MANSHPKFAQPDHPILDAIAHRWSPYAYDPRPVEGDKLLSCLEAARWAASSYNEQPWTFLLAQRTDQAAFATMLGCLLEANQAWAQHAGVLLLTVTCQNFKLNNKPNRVCVHDIGLAAGNFVVQAAALGLQAHQMAGVDLEKVRQTYNIPAGYDPVTAIALGYPLPASSIADAKLSQMETSPRGRKPLSEIVLSTWGQPAKL
ncbi:MAG TPA: nitroreductase family protein [Pirellulaceae bacterium]|nr:nitroreductase family protein [Pirellulaceae bacterium]